MPGGDHRPGQRLRDHWVRVGIAIHSQLLTIEAGALGQVVRKIPSLLMSGRLAILRAGWKSFRPGKIGLGSLIWEADKVDPGRTRFPGQQADPYRVKEKAVQEFRAAVLSFDEIIKQAREIRS